MPTIKTTSASTAVPADQVQVFKAVTDWESQSKWIFATEVRGLGADSHKLGGRLEAFTGYWKFGFLDTMTITKWDPPNVCEVTHTGNFVKGTGLFEVTVVNGVTYFMWTEYSMVPFGVIGKVAWLIVGPIAHIGLKISLRRFKNLF